MLMMEVETDPLKLKDPLDCKVNIQSNDGYDSPKWVIQLEPEIVSEIVTKDFNFEPKEETNLRAILRVRKTRNVIEDETKDDESDWEWKSQRRKKLRVKKKATKRRCSSRKNAASDEGVFLAETVKPQKSDSKKKIKRDNYLKKYKLMKEKRSYACDLCKKTFITASHLKEHILSHCQCFPCKECGKVFNHLRSLQRHVAAGHEFNPEHEPDGAEAESKNESEFTAEGEEIDEKIIISKKPTNRNQSRRKYQCALCQKTFVSISHLNSHMYSHSGKKWKCEGCGKNFSCERSLTRHKDTFPGEHWFPCQFCDMNFFRAGNIIKHMEIKHPEAFVDAKQCGELILSLNRHQEDETETVRGGDKIFICTVCLKIFYNLESLKVHKQATHSSQSVGKEEEKETGNSSRSDQVPRYKCSVCFKEFVSLEGFEYHKNNQHVEKKTNKKKRKKDELSEEIEEEKEEEKIDRPDSSLVCKICFESYPTKLTLQAHLKSHNLTKNVEVKSGTHQCCICPRSFASSDGLKYHLATHTGERRYSCAQCGKKFIKKTHLFEHVATHSQVKYFKCLRCPRTFSTHSAYRKHIKHFPGPHSFPCTKCGKLFTKESMIEKHMCVDLVNVTMAPEVKALLSGDVAEECSNSHEQNSSNPGQSVMATEFAEEVNGKSNEKESEEISREVNQSENNSHSCYKCFKVFPSLDTLQSHQYDHIGKQQYQCRFCPENFKRADDFSAHIRNHLGSTPYMCLKCNRKFISPLTLSMHAKKYPGDHSFTCQKCQRWFPSEKRLEKHECILQNSDIFVCACGSPFKNWNEFLEHAGSKPYKCCSCDLKYLTLIALARHIKKHTGIKPFSCEICGKSFRAKNNYLHHKNVHADAKEIQCEHCEFKSKSQKRMNFHLFRKHDIGSNTSSTLCPICGIIFPYITHMKKHIEVEHSNELVLEESKEEKKSLPMVLCTLCGKLLSNKYMLANHMKKVHDPDSPRNIQEFKCSVCDEKFRSKKRLQRHAEVHEAPGLRICEICSKEFYFAKDLRKHMKRHDTNKPFSCGKCGKNFKVSVSLKYHSSICGNVNIRSAGNKKRKNEKLLEENLYYGHIEPLELKNCSYAAVVYGR